MKSNANAIIEEMKKIKEEMEWQEAVRKVYSKKPKKYSNKLTASVKKAKHQAPGSLECFKEENMCYSDKEVSNYLKGTSIYENYQGTLNSDWD